jgi:cytidine deaminase
LSFHLLFLSPCGACRQFIAIFGPNWNVILVRDVDNLKVHSVKEMLPFAFDSEKLEMKRVDF